MENRPYYEFLTNKIFFEGITPTEILSVAKYHPGKSFRDLEEAVKQGRLEGLGNTGVEFGCIADRLSEVVEINPAMPFSEYIGRLRKK